VADYHAAWGFIGWGLVLLTAVALVVVPMFQLTPNYPAVFGTRVMVLALVALAGWNAVDFFWPGPWATLAAAFVVAFPLAFAVATVWLQRRSKRPRFDPSQHFWRLAMLSTLLAALLWSAAMGLDTVGEWQGWPLLLGSLVIFGGFVSVITGMLYKIVPFLIWLHLQNLGSGRLMAPNMKKIIDETAMMYQLRAHGVACLLLALATVWPEALVYPAGIALIVSQGWLALNLRAGMRVYSVHRRKLDALPPVSMQLG